MNRPLGASEHLLWRLAEARPINAVVSASVTGPLTVSRLRRALEFVQKRHALLAVRIQTDARGQPHFVSEGVPSLPLRVVSRRNEEHWVQEAEEELTRPFAQGQGPLLRVTLLQGPDTSELLLTFDHAIGDGMSGVLLVRDLLHELSMPGNGQLLPEPAASEELLPPGVPPPGTPPAVSRASLPDVPRAALRLLSSQDTPEDGRQVRLLTCYLPEDETAHLAAASRRERSSVHGALCAAFLLSLAGELDSRNECLLTVMSPVNLRGHLVPPGEESFAVRFSRQLTHHRLGPGSPFWEVARDVKHQLHRDTEGPGVFTNVLRTRSFLDTKPDTPSLQSFARQLMGSELTVSNLGRLGFGEQHGDLRLRWMHGTVSGLAPLIVGVMTVGGGLCVCSRFLEHVIPGAGAQRIQQRALAHLRTALASGK
ncbi:phthiocerol/phthiodiolone dimycocerosyl transferase family protein [Archangium lansingense]|uniref:Phthiocerol/phthiodiolone dimycocerosyl transferase n=1 Tax=Archangium lansingense TaxID=2995310 RepID=A0ABT4AB81_9BACT|nr:condensation domain-containing protein [Archangium lansinium]MCY1078880.1 condensation domain-containing protein [Archangium lansinium]